MFETLEAARVKVPFELAEPDEYVWEFVYTRLHMHWFHVTAKRKREIDGYQEVRNFFFVHIEDLLVISESSNWTIVEVCFVSPAHMNGTDHWTMKPLTQILKGREAKLENIQYGYVFVMQNGKRYVDSFKNCEEDLIDIVCIYDSINHR